MEEGDRNHIRIEHQLRIHIEKCEQKIEDLESQVDNQNLMLAEMTQQQEDREDQHTHQLEDLDKIFTNLKSSVTKMEEEHQRSMELLQTELTETTNEADHKI